MILKMLHHRIMKVLMIMKKRTTSSIKWTFTVGEMCGKKLSRAYSFQKIENVVFYTVQCW